jgi:hypothetical protein
MIDNNNDELSAYEAYSNEICDCILEQRTNRFNQRNAFARDALRDEHFFPSQIGQ